SYLGSFFTYLVLKIDILMVNHYLGSSQAGYYSIAVNMADLLCTFPFVVATLLFPALSAQSAPGHKLRLTGQVSLFVGVALTLLIGLSASTSAPLIRFIFGNAYAPAIPAFLWLLPGVLFLGIHSVVVQFLKSVGYPKGIVVVWAACTLINVIANAVII